MDLVARLARVIEPLLFVGVLGENRPLTETTSSDVFVLWYSRDVRDVVTLGTSSVCRCCSRSGCCKLEPEDEGPGTKELE